MFRQLFLFLFLIFIIYPDLFSQNTLARKKYETVRIDKAPKIDGNLDDEAWKRIEWASDFVMIEPGDGDPIPRSHRTGVKLVYDDEALYIAAKLEESNPERIMNQFTQRDNLQQAEFFLMDINTYDDGENQTRFVVTAAGTQADARMTGQNEDYAYNVVWESAVGQDENAWYVEMKIPYSALRFPKRDIQTWGIQFYRNITHLNEAYVWNYINKSVGQNSQYTGLLTGISNIDPPVRLSLYPYTSAAVDRFDGSTNSSFNAGMDLKYGINDSFTLDLTLVPDFGQTAYDEVELNLGPFEQIFGENRAFFTEGTELFTKGDLFYSRRVGSIPIGYNAAQAELLENEEIIDNPDRTDLLNALKVSGRTKNGLGIGFFNAITDQQQAVYRDTLTGKTRRRTTEPVANYNILVLDQQFNKNSSISLINTNVTRNGHFRDGNVTGFLFDIFNKDNSYNFSGEAKMSNVNLPGQNETGFASFFSAERTKGNFRYSVAHEFANETYDINDLGINFTNNYNNLGAGLSYRIFEPRGALNTYVIRLNAEHLRRYMPDMTMNTSIGGSFFAMTRDRFAFGGGLDIRSKFRDFFEPRAENRYVEYNKSGTLSAFISSDYRKQFALDVRLNLGEYYQSSYNRFGLNIEPRFRFSDKFNMVYELDYTFEDDRPSYVDATSENIIFGNRDQKSLGNSINANFNFNTKQGINLRFRNFWSTAEFSEKGFTSLGDNGSLANMEYSKIGEQNPDANFNIWNLDLSYRWQFAPGSEAVLLYRNSIFNQDKLSELGFNDSLDKLFAQPARHNLSLRIVYFIDYNRVKHIFQS